MLNRLPQLLLLDIIFSFGDEAGVAAQVCASWASFTRAHTVDHVHWASYRGSYQEYVVAAANWALRHGHAISSAWQAVLGDRVLKIVRRMRAATAERPFKLTPERCFEAASDGSLQELMWLRSLGCAWDEDTCSAAARRGKIDMLVFCRASNPPCPWDVDTCAEAAFEGHFHLLRWLRARGCPWDESLVANAARGDHVAIVEWAIDGGCPWDYWNTCVQATHWQNLRRRRAPVLHPRDRSMVLSFLRQRRYLHRLHAL